MAWKFTSPIPTPKRSRETNITSYCCTNTGTLPAAAISMIPRIILIRSLNIFDSHPFKRITIMIAKEVMGINCSTSVLE